MLNQIKFDIDITDDELLKKYDNINNNNNNNNKLIVTDSVQQCGAQIIF
jgi:hypothetical protein